MAISRQQGQGGALSLPATCASCSTLQKIDVCFSVTDAAGACCNGSSAEVWIEAGSNFNTALDFWADQEKAAYAPDGFYAPAAACEGNSELDI